MCAHRIPPRGGPTWDDLCELWDHGAFTTVDIKNITPLYFDGAELSAVLDVIEMVDNDSNASEAGSEARRTDPEDKRTFRMDVRKEAA